MQNTVCSRIGFLLLVLFSLPLGAQEKAGLDSEVQGVHVFTLKEAAQSAVLKNPEVLARWHAFREAAEEVNVAKGGFLPRVDVSAAAVHERSVQQRVGTDLSYNGNETSLTLRQMVFDGFATTSEVKRLGKAKLVRYFELLDATENTALEAGRAYLDVVRYRAQVVLAEDNYIQHQSAYDQLKRRAESGVGKRVDVDQAASRLALADVNLTTAYANLHDVMARYVRVVGDQPAKDIQSPAVLTQGLPATSEAALIEALKHNPGLRASVENVEAAQYDLEGRRAAFMPRVDVVASRNGYSNYQDEGSRTDSRIELRLNYNLFNGGSDVARSRQYRERKDIALDQREKACRDMRQTLSIAFNDTLRLNDQMTYIGEQVRLVEKTRAAYRDQFNIGQRTLLDLLNTQNEYFDARRTQINADVDRSLAYLRSYAGMGKLLEVLELKRVDADSSPDEGDLAQMDAAQLCPPMTPADATLDREDLARKIKEMRSSPNNAFMGGTRAAAEVPSPKRDENNPADQTVSEITNRTTAWALAWTSRDAASYLAFYAAGFKPDGGIGRDVWARQREQRLAKANGLQIGIQNLVVRNGGVDTAVSTFRQIYTSDAYRDATDKTLEWHRENGQWVIVRESAGLPVKTE